MDPNQFLPKPGQIVRLNRDNNLFWVIRYISPKPRQIFDDVAYRDSVVNELGKKWNDCMVTVHASFNAYGIYINDYTIKSLRKGMTTLINKTTFASGHIAQQMVIITDVDQLCLGADRLNYLEFTEYVNDLETRGINPLTHFQPR